MKYLILPDVHKTTFWKNHIAKYFDTVDHIYFLGDYFDSHSENCLTDEEAIQNFLAIVEFKKTYPEKVHLCIGNHDVQYLYGTTACSGYNRGSAEAIRKALVDNLEHTSLAYLVPGLIWNNQPVVVSHAGISKVWYDKAVKALVKDTETNDAELLVQKVNELYRMLVLLQKDVEKDNKNTEKLCTAEITMATLDFPYNCFDPYGDDPICPPTWIRPNSLFASALFSNQIVGHTSLAEDKACFYRVCIGEDITNIVFVDSVEHDLALLLDSDATYEWQTLMAKEKQPEDLIDLDAD